MLILAINTASSKTAIALLWREKFSLRILREKSWTAQNNEAEKLMPETALLFQHPDEVGARIKTRSNKFLYTDIDELIVVKGPGSFTGLRVGVTVANTIANLEGAKLYAISTFEYLHAMSKLPVIVYAGKGAIYFSENIKKKPKMLNLEKALELFKKLKLKSVHGDISDEQKRFFAERGGVKFKELKNTFGETIQKILKRKLKPQKIVNPLYIKKPQITPSTNQLNLYKIT